MSSESDEEEIVFHQKVDDKELESSSEHSSLSDEADKLLTNLRGKLHTNQRITKLPVKKAKFVTIQQSDLGRNFDPNLVQSLSRIESVKKEIETDSTTTTATVKTFQQERKEKVRLRIEPNNVSSQYIDLVTRENISGRYIDWHFIAHDTKFEELELEEELFFGEAIHGKYPTILDLLKSLGAEIDLLSQDKPFTNKRDYDPLCEITPVDAMMKAIGYYQNDKDFDKLFLCFILDRKIWESQECDSDWCSQMLKCVDNKNVIDSYLSLTDCKDYFMHYRLSRCLPHLKSFMVDRIVTDNTSIEDEFTQLIDSKNYKSLLYFVLFIYGSQEMPFGPSSCTRSFRDRVEKMCNEGTNAVELSLLRSILNLFLKIR